MLKGTALTKENLLGVGVTCDVKNLCRPLNSTHNSSLCVECVHLCSTVYGYYFWRRMPVWLQVQRWILPLTNHILHIQIPDVISSKTIQLWVKQLVLAMNVAWNLFKKQTEQDTKTYDPWHIILKEILHGEVRLQIPGMINNFFQHWQKEKH